MANPIVVGSSVKYKHDRLTFGKVQRIYPFNDKPNVMVKWSDGRFKSYFANELRTA
jgi:hypothetical protein